MSKKQVEALLFVTKEPIPLEEISKIINEEKSIVLRWLLELQKEYNDRGIQIRQVAGGFEMVTADDLHETIEKIVPKQIETLSRAALETVTIIAYNQPVKRAYIAKLRGVSNPDYGIQTLLDEKLVEETEEGFVTTENFLKYFGINDLKELPEIKLDENQLLENEESQEEPI